MDGRTPIERAAFHGDWNDVLHPRTSGTCMRLSANGFLPTAGALAKTTRQGTS